MSKQPSRSVLHTLILTVVISFLICSQVSAQVDYQVISVSGITWQQARDSAIALGGHLVTITDQGEQQEVTALTTSGYWWIGATDEVSEGNWTWITGEPWSFSNWYPEEGNGGSDENYGLIAPGVDDGKWGDFEATASFVDGFIVEWSPTSPFPKNLRMRDSLTSTIITSVIPIIEWEFIGSELPQAEYEIEVGTDQEWSTAEMWATGPVASSDESVLYNGLPLAEQQDYFLRVRLSDGVVWGVWKTKRFLYVNPANGAGFEAIVAPDITWEEANDSAAALGGVLATILNEAEQFMVGELIEEGAWWIGATDEGTEGNWRWLTGEPWTYTNWISGEPNGGTDENAGAVHAGFTDRWADYNSHRENLSGFIMKNGGSGPYPAHLILVDSLTSTIITTATPTIIWQYTGSESPQVEYEIEVGTDNDWTVAEVWASGPVSSADTSVLYTGPALQEGQQYHLRVRLYDGTIRGIWRSRQFQLFLTSGGFYQVINAPELSWNQARDSAIALGGNLVTITSASEQNFVEELVDGGIWWIGATDVVSEGNWEWVTGEPWDYTNWLPGEPNGGTSENAMVLFQPGDSKWVDYNNNHDGINGFILEISSPGSGPYPNNLRVKGITNTGYTTDTNPTFLWHYEGSTEPQTEYEIQVGTDANWSIAEVWSPGPVLSSDTSVVYTGIPLVDRQRYFYRVRVSDGITVGGWVNRSFTFVDVSNGPAYISIHSSGITWHQARDMAANMGGYLVTISSLAEAQLIANEIEAGDWWIGATDEVQEGNWQWVTGETFTFTNWFGGEPNGGSGENYAYLATVLDYKWVDRDADHPLSGFIIEIPVNGPYVTGLGFAEPYAAGYVGTVTPTVIWNFHDNTGAAQQAYEIEVGTDNDWSVAELWSTGEVVSQDNQALYTGAPLADGGNYHLRLRVNNGIEWGLWAELPFTVYNPARHTYQLILVARTWQQAVDSALLTGGYLATIENPLEDEVIKDLLGSQTSVVYIGGTDTEVEGSWKWVTGTQFTYTNWISGEPNNAGNEDYLQMRRSSNWAWNDGNGTHAEHFLIEWDDTPRLTSLAVDGVVQNGHVLKDQPEFRWSRTIDTLVQEQFEIEVGSNPDWTIAELWDPGTIVSSDSTIAYAGLPLVDGTTYHFRIRALFEGSWTVWVSSTFRMNTAPQPPAVSLTYHTYTTTTPIVPVAGGTDQQNDQLEYFFEGYADSLLTTLVGIDSTGPIIANQAVNWAVTNPFTDNRMAWWRCRVFDGFEYSNWSQLGSFIINVEPQPPSVAMLASPPVQPGKPVLDLTPVMSWQSFDPDPFDTTLYLLEVAADSNFVFIRSFDSLTLPEFEFPDSLGFNRQYWWRVTSYDKTGLSLGASLPRSFWTWTLGDVNQSLAVNVQDLTFMVSFFFANGEPISPSAVGDLNGDCALNIQDLVYMVNYLFSGGPAPKVGCSP